MEYRKLGRTGLSVSAISFGGLKLDGMEQSAADYLVAKAIDGGMNYFDTAQAYGTSETLLRGAFKNYQRDKFIVSSKCMRRNIDGFKAGFEASFEALGLDYIDFYFIHDVSNAENWQRVQDENLIGFLQDMKKAGRIGHLAISTHDCKIGAEMLATGLFEVAMMAYNASNTEIESELLPLAIEKEMGVVVMKPFGGGVLTLERSRQMGFEITAEDSLRFAVSKAGVSCVIPGIDKPEYLDTALKIADERPTMTNKEREAMCSGVTLRGKAYCRGCGYCLPCPKGIPIPTLLGLYNRWEVIKGVDWSIMHQIATEYTAKVPDDVTADNCIKCGACVSRCPYNLEIPELMEKAAGSMRRG